MNYFKGKRFLRYLFTGLIIIFFISLVSFLLTYNRSYNSRNGHVSPKAKVSSKVTDDHKKEQTVSISYLPKKERTYSSTPSGQGGIVIGDSIVGWEIDYLNTEAGQMNIVPDKIDSLKFTPYLSDSIALAIDAFQYQQTVPLVTFKGITTLQNEVWGKGGYIPDRVPAVAPFALSGLNLSRYRLITKTTLTFEKLKAIYELIPEEVLNGIYDEDTLTKIELLENSKGNKTYSFIPEEKLDVNLEDLDTSWFRPFYVFDVFKDSCSHGDKVLDVIKQVLKRYNLDAAFSKVIKYPINYFSNSTVGDSLYLQYYKKKKKAQSPPPIIDSVTFNNNKGSDSETPTKYLATLYSMAINDIPDIISSSYIGICEASYILGSLVRSDTITNYCAAALNDSGDIDNVQVVNRRYGGENYVAEPLAGYLEYMNKVGVVIIGNEAAAGKYEGMFSGTGKKIIALGRGSKWGLKNCTKCIDSLDNGTSYATPEIATKLFIAKAYWRKNNLGISALEARNRLLLATDLHPSFVGKFASAGNININKLLQKGNGFLVTNDDHVIPIDTIYKVSVSKRTQFGLLEHLFSSGKPGEYRGIYQINGMTYTIENDGDKDLEKWIQTDSLTEITINVKVADGSELKIYNVDEFYKQYKQLVVLQYRN